MSNSYILPSAKYDYRGNPLFQLLRFFSTVFWWDSFIWLLPLLCIIHIRSVFSKRQYWILSAVVLVPNMTSPILLYHNATDVSVDGRMACQHFPSKTSCTSLLNSLETTTPLGIYFRWSHSLGMYAEINACPRWQNTQFQKLLPDSYIQIFLKSTSITTYSLLSPILHIRSRSCEGIRRPCKSCAK